jgi:hypothetical protein
MGKKFSADTAPFDALSVLVCLPLAVVLVLIEPPRLGPTEATFGAARRCRRALMLGPAPAASKCVSN